MTLDEMKAAVLEKYQTAYCYERTLISCLTQKEVTSYTIAIDPETGIDNTAHAISSTYFSKKRAWRDAYERIEKQK